MDLLERRESSTSVAAAKERHEQNEEIQTAEFQKEDFVVEEEGVGQSLFVDAPCMLEDGIEDVGTHGIENVGTHGSLLVTTTRLSHAQRQQKELRAPPSIDDLDLVAESKGFRGCDGGGVVGDEMEQVVDESVSSGVFGHEFGCIAVNARGDDQAGGKSGVVVKMPLIRVLNDCVCQHGEDCRACDNDHISRSENRPNAPLPRHDVQGNERHETEVERQEGWVEGNLAGQGVEETRTYIHAEANDNAERHQTTGVYTVTQRNSTRSTRKNVIVPENGPNVPLPRHDMHSDEGLETKVERQTTQRSGGMRSTRFAGACTAATGPTAHTTSVGTAKAAARKEQMRVVRVRTASGLKQEATTLLPRAGHYEYSESAVRRGATAREQSSLRSRAACGAGVGLGGRAGGGGPGDAAKRGKVFESCGFQVGGSSCVCVYVCVCVCVRARVWACLQCVCVYVCLCQGLISRADMPSFVHNNAPSRACLLCCSLLSSRANAEMHRPCTCKLLICHQHDKQQEASALDSLIDTY